MNPRPRPPRIRTDREEFVHDLLIGLAGAFIVLVLALIGQSIAAPSANAHAVEVVDCREYASTHRLVTGSPTAAHRARKACDRAALDHAHAHCNRGWENPARRNACTIRLVFGADGADAVRVSWCESSHRTWAENGQYRGLFQMGSNERATYGHGTTAREQSEAAYRYFIASGRDWSPWECQP